MKGNYKLFFITIILLGALVSCSPEGKGNNAHNQKNSKEETSAISESKINSKFQIGTQKKNLVAQMGKPLEEMYYLGGRLMRYEKEGYFLDENDKVNGLYIIDPSVEIFKARVGMSIDEIIKLIGKPVESYFDDGETQFYYTVFKIEDWKIIFSSVNETSPTSYALAMYKID